MTQIVITGLAASYGDATDLEAFARALYAGECITGGVEAPAEELAQRVIVAALADADLAPEVDVTALLCDAGEVFAVLDEARRMLAEGEAEAVVVAAIEKNDLRPATSVISLDTHYAGRRSDAGAIVLQRAAAARRVYAMLADEPVAAQHIALLESVTPEPERSIFDMFKTTGADLTFAFGSVAANLGYASPMASLLRAVLSLHRRTFYPQAGWNGPANPAAWEGTPFYVAPEARTWFHDPVIGQDRRCALVVEGKRRLLLAEPALDRDAPLICAQPGAAATRLVLLSGADADELLTRLDVLHPESAPLEALAQAAYRDYRADALYALALVARDAADLQREIAHARDGVRKAFATGRAWSSPRGSAFTPAPLGGAGIAFVYPGAFNAYVGLGRELLQHFPDLHERLDAIISNPGRALAERLIYPRSAAPLRAEEREACALALANTPVAMIQAGTTFSLLYTAILHDIFGVQPRAALGYSLGEISMLWAGGVWASGDAGSAAWRASPLFKTRLFGPMEAVREHWGLDAGARDFWASYLLKAPVEKVRAALAEESRVYLTLINLCDEAVIAGDPAGCCRVIEALDCHALRVPFDSAIHNPAMAAERETFAGLYTHAIARRPDVAFYSAAEYAPLSLESEALAQAIAGMCCKPVNFPRLVEAAYAGGARLFIELGPQATCTRWIGRILKGQPHAAVAINQPGLSDWEGVLKVLAILVTQRVPVNLVRLYEANGEWRMANEREGEKARKRKGESANQQIAEAAASADVTQYELRSTQYEFEQMYLDNLSQHAARVAEAHGAFLEIRKAMVQHTAALIGMQIAASSEQGLSAKPQTASDEQPATSNQQPENSRFTFHVSRSKIQNPKSAILDEQAIRALALGHPADVFPEYAAFRGRKVPRLPNGDLLVVSRVAAVEGERGRIAAGTNLTAEYDVPAEAWYLREAGGPLLSGLPYSILMEMALQPCGVLSTWMGSLLPQPVGDFYFRNLDGETELLAIPDVRDKTLTNRVRLLSHTDAQGIILQKYAFEVACEGEVFYRGWSSFGYFSPAAMAAQRGLDRAASWAAEHANGSGRIVATARRGPLEFLDHARLLPEGGKHGLGYVYAESRIRSEDWFFANHFYEDPVMPGSLGVEAARQALALLAAERGWGRSSTLVPGPTAWRYRGQVPPETPTIALEVHISNVQPAADGVHVTGEGSLWRDGMRIYAMENINVLRTA